VLSAKTLPKEDIKLDELILGFANLGGIILWFKPPSYKFICKINLYNTIWKILRKIFQEDMAFLLKIQKEVFHKFLKKDLLWLILRMIKKQIFLSIFTYLIKKYYKIFTI
jgi:hypothetical protein